MIVMLHEACHMVSYSPIEANLIKSELRKETEQQNAETMKDLIKIWDLTDMKTTIDKGVISPQLTLLNKGQSFPW